MKSTYFSRKIQITKTIPGVDRKPKLTKKKHKLTIKILFVTPKTTNNRYVQILWGEI